MICILIFAIFNESHVCQECPPQIVASMCCHAEIEALQSNLLKLEKESKLLYGADNTALNVTFTVSIKFKKPELDTSAKLKNMSQSGKVPMVTDDESSPVCASWFSSVSSCPKSLIVADHCLMVRSSKLNMYFFI